MKPKRVHVGNILGVRIGGHTEEVFECTRYSNGRSILKFDTDKSRAKSQTNMYKHFLKRVFDFLLSLIGAIILLPFFIIFGIIIFIDDPGPIFFTQKRVGKNKKLFRLIKFRTMKTKTPDIPTHLLEKPEKYITRFGKILRKLSIDELPQIYNILVGQMSIIGPRPALWNQDDLIAERDKYGANDIRPGLTGWAQINGRDELEIPVKAAFDGEYVKRLGFAFDCKCFFGTIAAVFKHEGVVEGGTGKLHDEDKPDDQQTVTEDTCAEPEAQESMAVNDEIAETQTDDNAARIDGAEMGDVTQAEDIASDDSTVLTEDSASENIDETDGGDE